MTNELKKNPYSERLKELEDAYAREANKSMRKKIGSEYKKLKEAEQRWKNQSIRRTRKELRPKYDVNANKDDLMKGLA